MSRGLRPGAKMNEIHPPKPDAASVDRTQYLQIWGFTEVGLQSDALPGELRPLWMV